MIVLDPIHEKALGHATAGDWHRSIADPVELDAAPDWAWRALHTARQAVNVRLEEPERSTLRVAVEGFTSRRRYDAIRRLGLARFREVLVILLEEGGGTLAAEGAWLAPDLGFDARRRLHRDELDLDEATQKRSDWSAFAAALDAIAPVVLRQIVPILLAAITPPLPPPKK